MNHKWDDNVCVNCGVKREKKEYKRLQRTYTALGYDGCWNDVPVYKHGTAWYYGVTKFIRPDCKINKHGK